MGGRGGRDKHFYTLGGDKIHNQGVETILHETAINFTHHQGQGCMQNMLAAGQEMPSRFGYQL